MSRPRPLLIIVDDVERHDRKLDLHELVVLVEPLRDGGDLRAADEVHLHDVARGGIAVRHDDVEARVEDVSAGRRRQGVELGLEDPDGSRVGLVPVLDAVRLVTLGVQGLLLLVCVVADAPDARHVTACHHYGDVGPFVFSGVKHGVLVFAVGQEADVRDDLASIAEGSHAQGALDLGGGEDVLRRVDEEAASAPVDDAELAGGGHRVIDCIFHGRLPGLEDGRLHRTVRVHLDLVEEELQEGGVGDPGGLVGRAAGGEVGVVVGTGDGERVVHEVVTDQAGVDARADVALGVDGVDGGHRVVHEGSAEVHRRGSQVSGRHAADVALHRHGGDPSGQGAHCRVIGGGDGVSDEDADAVAVHRREVLQGRSAGVRASFDDEEHGRIQVVGHVLGEGLRLGDGGEDVRVEAFRHGGGGGGSGGHDDAADGAAQSFQDSLQRAGRNVAHRRHGRAGETGHVQRRTFLRLGVELRHQSVQPRVVGGRYPEVSQGSGRDDPVGLAQLEGRAHGGGADDHHQEQAVLVVRGGSDEAVKVVDLYSGEHAFSD